MSSAPTAFSPRPKSAPKISPSSAYSPRFAPRSSSPIPLVSLLVFAPERAPTTPRLAGALIPYDPRGRGGALGESGRKGGGVLFGMAVASSSRPRRDGPGPWSRKRNHSHPTAGRPWSTVDHGLDDEDEATRQSRRVGSRD